MKSRFSHLLTMGLAGACGFLLLLLVLFQFGAGKGYRWWPAETAEAIPINNQLDRSTFKLPAWEEFADVNTRPLFNEDRKPTPPAPPDPGPDTQKPVPKLNITLTGVVLTPKVHIAMIVENGKAQSSTAVREGHALPGELAAWTLTKVKARGASFKSSAGEELELELIAKGSGLKPPPPAPAPTVPMPTQPPGQPQADAQPGRQPEQNAELQQRIEARRKQLQEQAERAKQQQGGNPPPGQQQPQAE
jgi:general secretion pathway protein N